jgi:hypothetical protein
MRKVSSGAQNGSQKGRHFEAQEQRSDLALEFSHETASLISVAHNGHKEILFV